MFEIVYLLVSYVRVNIVGLQCEASIDADAVRRWLDRCWPQVNADIRRRRDVTLDRSDNKLMPAACHTPKVGRGLREGMSHDTDTPRFADGRLSKNETDISPGNAKTVLLNHADSAHPTELTFGRLTKSEVLCSPKADGLSDRDDLDSLEFEDVDFVGVDSDLWLRC